MKIKVWSLVALAPFASAALHPLSAAQIACLEMTEKAVHSAKKDDPIFIKYFGEIEIDPSQVQGDLMAIKRECQAGIDHSWRMGRPRGPAADDPMLNMSTFPRDDCLESRGDHLIGYWADEQGLPGELFARYARAVYVWDKYTAHC